MKVFEAFAGYGSQSMALKRANIDFEVVGISEIDKYAICSYMAVHGETKNFGDISLINEKELPDFDLFTYSFPCSDISLSGKQLGIKEGTRSGLLWECERIISHKLPKYLLMENVKNLVGKKFKPDFDRWCKFLEDLGYKNHWQVLNAKEYGIPQNRERVFMVSILGGGEYRFPEKEELNVFLKDICEEEVDEKYYLRPEQYSGLIEEIKHKFNSQQYSYCIDANYFKGGDGNQYVNKCRRQLVVGCAVRGRNPENPTSRVSGLPTVQMLESDGKEISNCLTTVQKDSLVLINKLKIKTVSNVVRCGGRGSVDRHSWDLLLDGFRVRKLTPLECFRLMDVSDEDFFKIQKALNETFYKGKNRSSSQLYKLAGNSIVVKPLMKIFKNMNL